MRRIKESRPSRYAPPIRLEIDFADRQVARYTSWMPEITYDGDSTVAYTSDDFLSVYEALLALFWLATSKLNL